MEPKEHWKAIEEHGFHLDKDIVGEHLANYDSILVLSHFSNDGDSGSAYRQPEH